MPDAPPPVFTIGHREEYVEGMLECRKKGDFLLKLGQQMAGRKGLSLYFMGGIIFQNPRDARRYIDEEYLEEKQPEIAVFEVRASWEHDCYSPGDDMYWRYLTYNRPITLIVVENEKKT